MARTQRKLSEETKEKMRQAKLGAKNHRYGKKMDEETKKKISESMKKYWENLPYEIDENN